MLICWLRDRGGLLRLSEIGAGRFAILCSNCNATIDFSKAEDGDACATYVNSKILRSLVSCLLQSVVLDNVAASQTDVGGFQQMEREMVARLM